MDSRDILTMKLIHGSILYKYVLASTKNYWSKFLHESSLDRVEMMRVGGRGNFVRFTSYSRWLYLLIPVFLTTTVLFLIPSLKLKTERTCTPTLKSQLSFNILIPNRDLLPPPLLFSFMAVIGFDANAPLPPPPPPQQLLLQQPPQALLERLKDYGQEDVFALWDELSHEERDLLVKDIEVYFPHLSFWIHLLFDPSILLLSIFTDQTDRLLL